MDKIIIDAQKRDLVGKKVKHLRKQGRIPAIIIEKGQDSIPISVEGKSTVSLLRSISSSSLLTIVVDGNEYVTLLREVQRDSLKNIFLHFDFQKVSMTEKITVNIPLNFIGDAPASKTYDGLVNTLFDVAEVECMAVDIPESIDVDLTVLEDLNSSISFGDLVVPDNVTVTGDLEEKLVVVTAPVLAEEEEEVEDELLDGDVEPEVIEKGKSEEEDEE